VPSETLILFPPFRLDPLNAQLWRDDELVAVRPKAFAVLAYLVTHAGRLVTVNDRPRFTEHAPRSTLDEAHKLLTEFYGWFTEGFDTKDLQEAKALIERLSH